MSQRVTRWSLVVFLVCSLAGQSRADDQSDENGESGTQESPDQPVQSAAPKPKGNDAASPMGPEIHLKALTRLSPEEEVWIDPMRKIVVVNGKVCLRRGPLELFACPRGTKEHESVVSVNAKAQTIHVGLLAIGAMQGSPVRFAPKYKSATGTEVDIWILWKDKDGVNQKLSAQQWIRNVKTGKAMTERWVFAGSGFYVDEMTGKKHYQADGSGDFICVSNFSTATLDLPVESSAEAADLLYESSTERIPARGTQIRLVLIPRIKAPKDDGSGAN
jgi:hypothetical protein